MAYTTKTANSFTDILNHVRSFASTYCGFTDLGTETIGGYETHKLSKGGLFYSFRIRTGVGNAIRTIETKLTYIEPTAITGWSSTTPVPQGQDGNGEIGTYRTDAPYTGLYLFTDETLAVNCVLEITAGSFTHFSFGSIEKLGAFGGGEYIMGQIIPYHSSGTGFLYSNTDNSCYFFADGTGTTQDSRQSVMRGQIIGNSDFNDFAVSGNLQTGQRMFGTHYPKIDKNSTSYLYSQLEYASKCPYNFRTALLPIVVRLEDPNGSLQFIAGNVKDIKSLNMKYLQNKEIVDTDWQVFPRAARSGFDTQIGSDSSDFGIAYKRTGSAV